MNLLLPSDAAIDGTPHRATILHTSSLLRWVLFLLPAVLLFGCASSREMGAETAPRDIKELTAAIDKILADSSFINANWAVLVKNLDTDEILYDQNAHKSFLPASNGKIYTTAAGLDQLGPDYQYLTRVYLDGTIEGGVLNGNIIVRGSGDPVIGGRFTDGDVTLTFRTWADSLADLGVERITGDIIGDDNLFDDLEMGVAWSWDDEPYWYSAEISALSLNDNNIDFEITGQTEGSPALIEWVPDQTTYASVSNKTVTVNTDSSRSTRYGRRRGTNQFRIEGDVPSGRTYSTSLSVFNPTQYFVHVLRETLVRSGISVEGMPIDLDARADSIDYTDLSIIQFASHESPPLGDIVYELNKISHNLYAELLLKTLGTENPVLDDNGERNRDLAPGSAEMGLARAMDTFAAAGADTSRIHLKDGSGLSRMSYITAEMTSSVLAYMWSYPDENTRASFIDSLPIGGVDGTLKTRFRSGQASGLVRAKTGSLTGVSSLSGFIPTRGGSELSFVLMCNQFTVSTSVVHGAQDAIVELLATYRQ